MPTGATQEVPIIRSTHILLYKCQVLGFAIFFGKMRSTAVERYFRPPMTTRGDDDADPAGKQGNRTASLCCAASCTSAVDTKAQVKIRRDPNFYNSPFPLEASE